MAAFTLYPEQQREVNRALAAPRPIRWLFACSTGTGKSAMAIRTAIEAGAKRILVVTYAIVRVPWQDEFRKCADITAGVIDMGRSRKAPSKKAEARRNEAYSSDVQIVSYDLLGEVALSGWDVIIGDESHSLGNPLSAQSAMFSVLCDANLQAHIFLLSATPIPTVEKQIWHQLHLLQPGVWGTPSATGDVSWEFARKYLSITSTEYGKSIGSSTPEKREKLLAAISPFTSRLTMEDVAPHMPPLRVSPLQVKKLDTKFFRDYINQLPQDITHAAIFAHLKETAKSIVPIAEAAGWPVTYVDGEIPASRRSEILRTLEASGRTLLIGTYDAFPVGIRLLWLQMALICEFSASPGTMGQFLGRFASVGSAVRPAVQVAILPKEERLQHTLVDRTRTVNGVFRASGNEEAILSAFKVTEMTDTDVSNAWAEMFASTEDTTEWKDSDED